jgi:lipid-A-disaccharide synthase
MAKWAHQRGIRVVYYISPQLWAWKAGRVEQVRRYVDEMLVILPFEPAFYAQHGVQVTYVGHPLPDALAQLPGPDTGLGEMLSPTGRPIVALLPGSRKAEIRRMLPAMLEVARALPDYQFVVAGAPSQPLAFYTHLIGDAPVAVCSNQTYALLQLARAALVTSGTATLETALLNVPLVVAYQADALSYRIAKWVVGSRIRYISLVNLILDQPVVPECIQQEMHPKRLQAELLPLLETPDQPARLAQTTAFVHLRSLLGNGGASQQVAARLAHHLQPPFQPMA